MIILIMCPAITTSTMTAIGITTIFS
jgi:hypothetical protein